MADQNQFEQLRLENEHLKKINASLRGKYIMQFKYCSETHVYYCICKSNSGGEGPVAKTILGRARFAGVFLKCTFVRLQLE